MKIAAYCDIKNVLDYSCPVVATDGYPTYLHVSATVVQTGNRLELEYFEISGMGSYVRSRRNPNHWLCHSYSSEIQVKVTHSLISVIRTAAIVKAKNSAENAWEYEIYE